MKLVGERRALAAIVFAFYFLYFVLGAIQNGPPVSGMLYALAGCYGLAFFALVAGYFWARWYAVGVGLFGVIVAAVSVWQLRGGDPDEWAALWPILAFFGGTHALASTLLWGDSMAAPFDGKTEWREKLHMDDNAVQRLGRSVIRAGVGLPFVLMYAFVPKQDAGTAIAFVALGLAAFGLRAVIRARTWGILALGLAGSAMITLACADAAMGAPMAWVLRPALAGGLLFSAVAPWFGPLARTFAMRRA
ncbi:MAG TPA: hypothetical protein VGM90_37680 [Kofleriaceae bacterium]|jgi:hypothetical protein